MSGLPATGQPISTPTSGNHLSHGADENDNATSGHLPQTAASGNHLLQGADDAVVEYNAFREFLKKDAMEQQQRWQQQHHKTPRAVNDGHPQQPQGGREQDQSGEWQVM